MIKFSVINEYEINEKILFDDQINEFKLNKWILKKFKLRDVRIIFKVFWQKICVQISKYFLLIVVVIVQ